MGVYAVSFTLKYDDEYSERYASLMEQIRAKGVVWEETTSFALVETSETMDEFETRLWLRSKFNAAIDAMLVIDVSYCSAICRGDFKQKSKLANLLPGIVQK